MKSGDRSAQFITLAGTALILVFALVPPVIYCVMGVNQIVGSLHSTAEVAALQITRIINHNPEYWIYEDYRIAELAMQGISQDLGTSWQVFDTKGKIISRSPAQQEKPFLRRSQELHDFGRVVGRVEVYKSVREIIRKTVILGTTTLAAGLLGIFLLRRRVYLFLTRAERKVRESERKYRHIFNAESDAILLLDGEAGDVVDANDAALSLYGYRRDDFLRLNIADISAEPEESRLAMKETLKHGQLFIPLRKHVKKDGKVFPAEISTGVLALKGRKTICGIIRDITFREENEKKLFTYQNQLRALTAKLLSAEERERRDLAMVLHDEVGQLLAMTRLNLESADGKRGEEGEVRGLSQARSLLGQAIARTRSLTWELSSQSLYELGLEAAVEELCETFQKRFGLQCRVAREAEETELPEEIRGTLYRSVREILSNVLKHAGATEVSVDFSSGKGWLRVSVADNGRGFESEEALSNPEKKGRFGLFSIRERMNLLGGSLSVASSSGEGSKITLLVPLEEPGAGKGT
jgi:PAS domain S-box-containing protein